MAPRVSAEQRLSTFLMLRNTWLAEASTLGAPGAAMDASSPAQVSAAKSASTPSVSCFSSSST